MNLQRLKTENTYYDDICKYMFNKTLSYKVKRTYVWILILTTQYTIEIDTIEIEKLKEKKQTKEILGHPKIVFQKVEIDTTTSCM